MEQYIDKAAVVAEINRVLNSYDPNEITSGRYALVKLRDFLDTLETVNVGMDFNTFDDGFKAEAEKLGIDPDSELCKSIKDDLYATAIEYYKENRYEKN